MLAIYVILPSYAVLRSKRHWISRCLLVLFIALSLNALVSVTPGHASVKMPRVHSACRLVVIAKGAVPSLVYASINETIPYRDNRLTCDDIIIDKLLIYRHADRPMVTYANSRINYLPPPLRLSRKTTRHKPIDLSGESPIFYLTPAIRLRGLSCSITASC